MFVNSSLFRENPKSRKVPHFREPARHSTILSIFGLSGPEKGVITKGVFSLEESLESLKSLENGWVLLYFPQLGVLL